MAAVYSGIAVKKVKHLQDDLIFFLCMTLLSDKKMLFTAFYSISLMEMNEKCSVVVANVPNELSPLFTGEQAVGLDSCTAHAVAVESSFSLATVQ